MEERQPEKVPEAYKELEAQLFGMKAKPELSDDTRLIQQVLEKNHTELSFENGMFSVPLPDGCRERMYMEEVVAYAGNLLHQEAQQIREKAIGIFQLEAFTEEYRAYVEKVEQLHTVQNLYSAHCFYDRNRKMQR